MSGIPPEDEELIDAPEPSGLPPLNALLSSIATAVPPYDFRDTTDGLREQFPELAAVTVEIIDIRPSVPARFYSTPGSSGGPLLVWMHGGAFVAGDLDMPEANWVGLALAARDYNVLSVDYRKAIDGTTYPAPIDDVLAAWQWVSENAERLGAGAIHLGGASAGAALAAGAAQKLRDQRRKLPASIVLAYPTLHRDLPKWPRDQVETIRQNAGMTYFSSAWVREMTDNYVGAGGTDDDRYAFPAESGLAGLPPHLILLAENDSLRSSGEDYVRRLHSAGVPQRTWFGEGALHGFLNTPYVPAGENGISAIAEWLSSAAFLQQL